MVTRDEFEKSRKESAKAMADDSLLHAKVIDVLTHSDYYHWYRQMTWMGEPVLQFPQDLFAVQELVYRWRPKFIIELGVAWGGSLLFYASLMRLFGGARVIGIDLYIPPELRKRLKSHAVSLQRLVLKQGSSTDPKTIEWLTETLHGETRNLVILDSAHDHKHVLDELTLYAPFVGPGYYMVCGDTIIEEMPPQVHRPRPWGPGNSPKTALDEFLVSHPDFEPDKELENKLLFTCNPGGWLRRHDVPI